MSYIACLLLEMPLQLCERAFPATASMRSQWMSATKHRVTKFDFCPQPWNVKPTPWNQLLQRWFESNSSRISSVRARAKLLDWNVKLPFAHRDEERIIHCTAWKEYIGIPQHLIQNTMNFRHYVKESGHTGGRWLYQFFQGFFHWSSMIIHCYAIANNCTKFAKH